MQEKIILQGLTFDDVLLVPRYSEVVPSEVDVRTRIIPGMYYILAGQVGVSQLREVELEDLLRRDPVRIDSAAVERMLRGLRVLVTGAGGSIGGELCRQIARCRPAELILLGVGILGLAGLDRLRRRTRPEADPPWR